MHGTERPGGMEIARRFLRFFEERGHTVVPSASLVPAGDPTLLFTNAGMVQFKDVFLGLERRSYTRAASIQRCLRVSGKHNDLEQVGPSPRHHTLFFMAGNFSFGDYFKREAIAYAKEFVVGELAVPMDRLVATVLAGDDEAYGHWLEAGFPPERILQMGEKTNFWSMGDVGPCGPTAELHYDWGPERCNCGQPECGVALDNGCERWLEIWNLVFMQFDQAPDGTRRPLPRPGVDTGMGLERITSIVQQSPTNYDTDLFSPVADRIQEMLGHTGEQREEATVAYRVLADHGRAAAYLVSDGVTPGNEGRSYVLRMILRRALRFGRRLGFEGPFLAEVADAVIGLMGQDHRELVARRDYVLRVIGAEEDRFSHTLAAGLERAAEMIASAREQGEGTLSGIGAFRLYDTYGFPLEMTRDLAAEAGLGLDEAGFAREMEAQRQRSREGAAGAGAALETGLPADVAPTSFTGYSRDFAPGTVLALLRDGARIEEAGRGQDVVVVLDATPFYAEAGGQVGDTGRISARGLTLEVLDTRRITASHTGHLCRVMRGRVRTGARVRAAVDRERRAAIKRHHTATHLLHQALGEVLGGHVGQAGSLVAPERLRFDFTHVAPLSPSEREAVQRRVNEMVMSARRVRAATMPLEQAQRSGAKALFGEKYGEHARVIDIDGTSRELCGGTHLSNTGQVGLFTITSEGGVAAGIRRIEAVAGWQAYERAGDLERLVAELSGVLKAAPAELAERARRLADDVRRLERERETLQRQGAPAPVSLAEQDVGGVKVVTSRVDGAAQDALRAVGDRLREQRGEGAYLIGGVVGEKVNLVAMVTAGPRERGLRADDLVRAAAGRLGGSGGGRADLAQGAGRDPARLDEALAAVPEDVGRLIGSR